MAAVSGVRTAGVAVVVVAALLLGSPAWPSGGSGVVDVAHRGASRHAPENTVASFVEAVAARADAVELDVRLTRDGVPVVLHDASLARTTDVESRFPDRAPWLVSDFTFAEVRGLDAGAWKAQSYAGERVPTLDEVLTQLARSPCAVFIEVKDPDLYGGVGGIGAAVYDTVLRRWPSAWEGSGAARVQVQSADARFVEDFSAGHPGVPVGVIQRTLSADALPGFADDVEVHQASLTPDGVAAAQASGLRVGAWTVDDPTTMRTLASYVDSITTNDPGLLRGVLDADGATWTATAWPARDPAPPRWSVGWTGRYLRSPVVVTAALETSGGGPGAWQRAAVQRWSDGAWTTVAQRATDADGRFSVRLAGRAGLVVRVVSLGDDLYPLAQSPGQAVPLVKVGTEVRLGGTRRVLPRHAATLTIRWRAADGRRMSGKARLLERRRGEPWRFVRDLRVSAGEGSTTVRPGRRTTFYRVRGSGTWWRTAAADSLRVRVVG